MLWKIAQKHINPLVAYKPDQKGTEPFVQNGKQWNQEHQRYFQTNFDAY